LNVDHIQLDFAQESESGKRSARGENMADWLAVTFAPGSYPTLFAMGMAFAAVMAVVFYMEKPRGLTFEKITGGRQVFLVNMFFLTLASVNMAAYHWFDVGQWWTFRTPVWPLLFFPIVAVLLSRNKIFSYAFLALYLVYATGLARWLWAATAAPSAYHKAVWPDDILIAVAGLAAVLFIKTGRPGLGAK
jgi:hypothetical protein